MWKQLNKRGVPLTNGRSSSQKRLARIQYHNEMARRQYIAYQQELKDKERKRVEEERKRHADMCKKLNLPTSATSDECRDLENKLEQINLEKKRLQNEIIMRKKMEEKRLEEERLEKERLEKERLEEERLEKERLEKERLEKERLEEERLEKERLEKIRLEFEILKQKEINQLKLELENIKAEAEKLEKERLEKERLERAKKEKVRLEKERLEKIRLEKIRLEEERLEKIRLKKERVEREQKNRKFNILIRNTYRPNMFKECIESVQEQTHIIPILGNNVRIICCYDDKRSSKYLNKYKNTFKNIDLLEIVPNKSNTLQEYNLYCNNLMDKVKDGWILFLNDDNKFLNKHTLSNISKNIDNEDDIIFWSIPLGDAKKNNVYAKMLKNIDMNTGKQMTCDAWKTGFCVHSKHIRKARATAGHDGLDNFLANLLKKNKFNKKFLDQIVVHPVYNKRLFGLREEDYDLHALIRERGIKQCYMSEKIAHLKPIIQTNYKITDYNNRDSPCIFFGLYNDNDISIIIRNHIHGEKYIVPMGVRYLYDDTKSENGWDENHNSDFDNYKKTLTVNPLFLSISDKMTDLFKHNKEYSTRIHFDCVDKMLFKPTSGLGKKIFIFNGETPNLRNASIYGKKYIDQVIKHFPNTEIIWSSMTNVPYHKLSEIYNQVAIGLCLTEQKHEVAGLKEMNLMNIPIIHNHSIFGLKWKNVDDIMNIIKKKINLLHEVGPISQIRHKKILINSHSYLNDNAGDTIMVSNYMNLLMRNNNHITLITKYKCPDFIRNLIYKKYTIVITGDDTKNIMNAIDKYMYSVDYALIRNHEVLEEMKSKPYLNRVIFYGLDFHMDGLKKMNNKFHYIITQSELLKKKLVKNNIDSEKIYIVQPIVFKYDFNLPKKNDNEIRLVYCGTLRDEENILEIIEEFQKIHKKRPEVVLKIVYGKIHGDVTFTRKVNEYIKNGVKGITFKHNLSHKDACYEIATSDIGICWRKNGWGDNGEVSTKVREYKMYGLEIINNINTINNNIYKDKIINNNFINKYFKIAVVKDFEKNIKKIKKKLEEISKFIDLLIVIYTDKKNISNNFKYFKAIEINICEFGEIPNTFRICKYFKNSTIFPIHISYIDLYDKLYFEKSKNNITNICKNFYYLKNYKLVNYFLSNFTINTIPENVLLDLCITDENMVDFELSKLDFYYEEKYINVSILDLERKEDYIKFLKDHSNENQHIVINLNKSIDRKLHVIESFKKIGINPIFYTPVDFDYIKDHHTKITKIPFKFHERKIAGREYQSNIFDIFKICYQINNNQKIITQGAFSYLYTYKEILKYAIKNRLKNLFIYDDDVAFHHNYNISEELLNTNNGIISLGAMDFSWEKNIKTCVNKLYNCKGTSYGSHALIINKNVFHKLLYVLENKILPVDCSPLHLFKYNFDSKIMYPNMAVQRIFKSNINSSNVQHDIQSNEQNCSKKYGWNMKDYFLPTIKTILIFDEKMSDEIKSIFNSWEINIDFQYIKDKFIYDVNNYDYIFLYINNNTIQENKSMIKENTIIIEKEFLYNKDSNLTYYTCDSLLKSNKYENKYRCVAVLATFMKRFHVVKKVINNILPQVDNIYIYANDYSEKNKQDLLKMVNSKEKVEILLGNIHDGDIKDNGKLYLIHNIVKKINHDYIIVIDDDLNYPSDYVDKHIRCCLKYNNNVVSSIHGGLFSNIIYDLFDDRHLYHYRSNLKGNKFVTYTGTGTICIPCKFTKLINYDKTMYTGMVDMYFMNNMKFFDVKRVCISRNTWGWLSEFDEIDDTLYDTYKNDNTIQLNLINLMDSLLPIKNNNLSLISKEYSYIISIKTTINRIEYLNDCIYSIIKNVNLKNVLIIVAINSEVKKWIDYNIENIVYITSKIKGAAYQNNTTIKYIKDNNIKCKNIFLIDDDIIVSKDIFSYTIENNELNKHICAYKRISSSPHTTMIEQRNNPNYEEVDIDFVQGMFMNISSEIIEKVGFFDYFNFPIRSDFHKDYTIRCSRCNFCDKNTISCLKEVNKHINLQNNLVKSYIPSIEWNNYKLIKNPKEQKRRTLVINNDRRKYVGMRNYNIVSIKNSFNFTNYHFEQDIDNSIEYIIKYLDTNKQNTLFIYGISASKLYLKNYNKIINKFKELVINKYLNTKLFFYIINESEINIPFLYLNDDVFIFIETIDQWKSSKILNKIQEIFI